MRASRRGAFECLGTDVAPDGCDGAEDAGPDQISGFVDVFADTFLFSTAQEGFRYRLSQQLPRLLVLGSRLLA